MSILTKEQLPNSNAQFIAYGNPTRVADPFGGEEPISVRPQVFVRYYRGVKIKDLRTPNDDTVNVVIDPESAGLQKEFGAYMNSDDPLVPYLREQHEAGKPIDVGLEYVRRQKAKNNKAEISPVTPIHALRGANDVSGSGENSTMMGVAGNHIRSIVGVVNGRRSTVIESEPREWRVLTGNRKGDLPPEGWKALLDREDWTHVGAIVPKGESIPDASAPAQQGNAQGGFPDMQTIVKMLRNEVRTGLKDYGEYLLRQDDAERGTTTSSNGQSASSVEGKPWNVWVNKEHLNLGSYLVASEGYALRWAYRYLDGLDASVRNEAAQELAQQSQKIADGVQAAAYRGEVRADRSSASYKEAVMWVRFHIEETYPFGLEDDFDAEEWFNNVGRTATESLTQAEQQALAHLEERHPQARKAQEETSTEESAAATNAETPASDGNHVLDAYLQVLGHGWTDKDQIFALAREGKEKGLLNTQVWADPRNGRFATTEFEGARPFTIADLTKNQYAALKQAAEQAPAETGDTTNDDGAPAAKPENTENPEETPEPEAEATPATPEDTGTPKTSPEADRIGAQLAKATTIEEVQALYGKARDANLLTAEIKAKEGAGAFGYGPVHPKTEDTQLVALGVVFNEINERTANWSTTPEAAPAKEETPADEAPEENTPEAAPAQDAPAADSAPTEGSDEAQQIADAVAGETDVAKIEELVNRAKSADLMNTHVTARNVSGPLGGLLKSRLTRAKRSK